MKLERIPVNKFETVRDFYWNLIDEMKDRADTVGWKKGIYPTDKFIMESIEEGNLYVLYDKDELIGSVILNSSWNEGYEGLLWSISCDVDEILVPHALAVKPSVHGNGIGKMIVQDIIDLARDRNMKTIRLDILGGNVAAEKLYRSMGFQFVDSKVMYYEDTGWTEFLMYELVL